MLLLWWWWSKILNFLKVELFLKRTKFQKIPLKTERILMFWRTEKKLMILKKNLTFEEKLKILKLQLYLIQTNEMLLSFLTKNPLRILKILNFEILKSGKMMFLKLLRRL